MSAKLTTKRNWDAAGDLRALVGEVNVGDRGRNSDLNATDFGTLYRSVLASCATPEQRARAEAAKGLYDGTGTSVALPAVPKLLPLLAKSAPASGSQAPLAALPGVPDDTSVTAKEFRLRGRLPVLIVFLASRLKCYQNQEMLLAWRPGRRFSQKTNINSNSLVSESDAGEF